MYTDSDLCQKVTVTLPLGSWANVIAAIGASPLTLEEKTGLNACIFQAAQDTKRALA